MKTENFKDWTLDDLKDTRAYRQLVAWGDDYAIELFLSLAGKDHKCLGYYDKSHSLITLFEWASLKPVTGESYRFWQEIHKETHFDIV